MEPLWHVQLLGGLCAVQRDRSITRFRSHNSGILLAYLALFPGRTHTREELADMLWPEAESDAGRVNLRTVLSCLRRELEGPKTGFAPGSVLITAGHTEVRLNPAAVTTDVATFEGRIRAASRPAAARDEQIRLLNEAVSLYAGPLVPGVYEPWALAERDRLAAEYLRALGSLAAAHAAAGDTEQALVMARRAVTADPLSEKARTALIRLLAAAGDRMAAVRHYHEMERLLETQFGTAPPPELRLLVESLKNGHGAVVAPPRPGYAVSDSPAVPADTFPIPDALPAEHRLEPAVTPAAPPPPVPATWNLPPVFTPFFGRENERSSLAELLCSRTRRMVTVTGPGGSGKTRLAIETARSLTEYFPGGVRFVPLAEVRYASQIAGAVARSLGLTISSGASPLDQVSAALDGTGAPLLLVLDNFEQLVADGGAESIAALASRVPGLTLLVTSRQRLLLDGECEFPVLPLPVPDFPGTPERLLEFPSVQLFVSRAKAARPDFEMTDRNAEAVAKLCARLEGIPLALELAAAWSRTLTPAQMLDRLARRFDWLIARQRGVPERHATLRAAIEWSWELLPEHLQRFFARLSVFAGGWNLDAAEQVCEEPDALTWLAELGDHSLLLVEEVERTVDAPAEMRYRFLETLREFAGDHLDAGERVRLRERHAEFFLRCAEHDAPHRGGSRDQERRLDALQAEQANLRSALEWTGAASRTSPGVETVTRHLRLCTALADFWFLRGPLDDAERWLLDDDLAHSVISGAKLTGLCPGVLARFHHVRAEIAQIRDQPDIFTAAMHEAALLYERAGDTAGMGRVLGRLARRQHDLPYAARRQTARRARRLCRDAGDPWAEAEVLTDIAWLVRCRVEQYPRAHRIMARAIELYRAVGDEEHVAAALRERGTWYAWSCETERAAVLLDEALALARRRRNPREVGYLLWIHGYNTTFSGDLDRAADLLREGVQIARTIGDSFCLVLNLAQLGTALLGQGEDDEAEALFLDCLPRCRKICEANRSMLAEQFLCYEGLALIAADRGDLRRAARLLGLAWAMDRPGPDDTRLPPQPAAVRIRYLRTRAAVQNAPEDLHADWEWGRRLSPAQADRFVLIAPKQT